MSAPTTAVAPVFDGTQPCAQTDPEAFFPDGGGNPRAAIAVCGGCEFRRPCLDYALATTVSGYPVAGVWGGTTAVERRRLREAVGLGRATVRAERGAERDQTIRELFDQGVARNDIASRLGVSYQTVYATTRPADTAAGPADVHAVDDTPTSTIEVEAVTVDSTPAPPRPETVKEPAPPAALQPRPSARRWHPTELAAAVRALTAAGFIPAAIARELGVPISAVRRARKAAA